MLYAYAAIGEEMIMAQRCNDDVGHKLRGHFMYYSEANTAGCTRLRRVSYARVEAVTKKNLKVYRQKQSCQNYL